MSKPIFYEGQQVGCLMFGEGVVTQIANLIIAKMEGGNQSYYHSGAFCEAARPTLYPIEQYRAIIANLPAPQPEAWQPKPGEWCWFWDDDSQFIVVAKFVKITKNGKFKAQFEYYPWDNCAPFTGELPEHLKEVQP